MELFTICKCGRQIEPCDTEPPWCRAWKHVSDQSPYCHPDELFATPREGSIDARERWAA